MQQPKCEQIEYNSLKCEQNGTECNRMQQLGYEVHIENSSNASAVRDAIADHRNGM